MTQELDLKELRKVAEQATPGEWEVFDPNEGSGHSPLWCVANDEFHNPSGDEDSEWVAVEVHVGDKSDANHIATFDPPTVLALLSRLERDEKNADTYQTLYEQRAESLEQAQAQLARVRELHEEYVIYEWDEESNNPKLDASGKQIVLACLCRACSSDDSIAAAEDAEWDDSYNDVEYPCPTVRALDGEPV